MEKRRSSRNTNKRKKYTDEVDFNLSDDESLLMKVPDESSNAANATASAEGSASASGAATPGGAATPAGAASPSKDGGTGTATPKEVVTESGTGQSGPNYAFIVSVDGNIVIKTTYR